MIIGIDPGWASFGMAAVDNDALVFNFSGVPRDFITPRSFIDHILGELVKSQATINNSGFSISDIYIERYVSYGGVTTDPEMILMMIGALQYAFSMMGEVHMVRAIDWKPKVCKYLVRTKGFNNPYPSFDKKYSVLAAKELSGLTCKSDHTADAICLSYLNKIDLFNSSSKGPKPTK